MKVVIVTWQGGGATPPAFGLARQLSGRGHAVRMLAPQAFALRVRAAGALHRPLPPEAEFDPARGRQVEDQPDFAEETILGPALPEALAAELAREPADVVVTDYMLMSTGCVAEALPVASVALVHMTHYVPGGDGEAPLWGWRWQGRRLAAWRERLGLPACMPERPAAQMCAQACRADRVLVALPREFDLWPDAPGHVVHAGAMFEDPPSPSPSPPAPADRDPRPLIVVSLGSGYMHQERLLERIAAEIEPTGARVLLLTGEELAPGELDVPPGVRVEGFVPHAAVLAHAALVVTHAGVGTLMAAFAHGVPALCLPLGRDQHDNARRAEELGAARVLAAPEEVRPAVEGALASPALRDGARRMAAALAAYPPELGAREVERAYGSWAQPPIRLGAAGSAVVPSTGWSSIAGE